MSRVMNEGVVICCKEITDNFLTVVDLLVRPIKTIVKPKGSLETYFFIRQPPLTVNSSNLVKYPSLSNFFFLGIMIRSNIRSHQWSTVESYVVNSADLCVRRNRTVKMNYTAAETVSPSSTSLTGECNLLGSQYQVKQFVEEI